MSFHFATFVLSLFPVAVLEFFLQTFAWLQLLILSAKGAQYKVTHDKKKRKKKKQAKQALHFKRKKSIDVGLMSSESQKLGKHGKKGSITHATQQTTDNNTTTNSMPQQEPQLPSTPKMTTTGTEVDVLGDSILFESNERHRREFEGFLRSVKDIKDVNNWLKNFSNEAPKKIAIVKMSRRILDTDYGTTQAASALSFMFKFGLYPIVVHGGWNELSRDTISEVVARRKLFSARLKAEIRKCGVGAAILSSDVCDVEPAINPSVNPFKEKRTLNRTLSSGFVSAVGEGRRASLHMEGGLGFQVNSIDADSIISILDKGKIPIWDGVAVTASGTEIPLNGDVTTVELAHLLQPFRIIFACNDGGILDKNNKVIPVVYMDKDYDELMDASYVSQRRKIQVLQLKRIVSVVPPSCTVVVTAIDAVTHQLMYPRLANETIIKKAEENTVHTIEDIEHLDKEKLQQLIEDSFGRPLSEGYLDNLNENLYRIYVITGMDGEYNGCAVIMRGIDLRSDFHDNDSDISAHNHHSSSSLMPTSHSSTDLYASDSDPHQRIGENRRRNGVNRSESPNPSFQVTKSDSNDSFQIPTIEYSDATSTNSSGLDEHDQPNRFYYLCKFCVRKSAQGAGLGDLLWRSLQRDIDRLYWRSRTTNPLNAWYYARCQGSFRADSHFTVFWYGDDRFEDGAPIIVDALARPLTILPVPT